MGVFQPYKCHKGGIMTTKRKNCADALNAKKTASASSDPLDISEDLRWYNHLEERLSHLENDYCHTRAIVEAALQRQARVIEGKFLRILENGADNDHTRSVLEGWRAREAMPNKTQQSVQQL